jgi:hypothetical protein
LFLLLAVGCAQQEAPAAPYKPEAIRVYPAALTLVPGVQEQLTASVLPAVANTPLLHWSSSNAAVATVADGWVDALSPGAATITVSCMGVSATVHVEVVQAGEDGDMATLYSASLNGAPAPAILVNGVGAYTAEGLRITSAANVAKLDKFYALAERMAQYRVRLSADARAVFRSSDGGFVATVDVPNRRISIATNPVAEATADFLQGDRELLVEIYHIYQQAKVRVVDVLSGEEAKIVAVHDGVGGVGAGVVNPGGFNVGMQYDHYCFGLAAGASMLVKQVAVYALKGKVKLLLYGDSVTQPEGYFPTVDFPKAWTQCIISRLNGNAMSSGRGGAIIDTVQKYIKNELPYIRAEYVMVTIGTNGGNTEANLSELVEYIKARGAIPILNNIPCNEHGTQVAANALIDQVRRKYNLHGCRFDLATSLHGNGLEVDTSTMYWENYTNGWGDYYHHPNAKGGQLMFEQTLQDVPEIYE